MQTCAPGPSAVLTALVLAGLPTDAFHFAGFLPNATNARRRAFEGLAEIRATLAFYESPNELVRRLGMRQRYWVERAKPWFAVN